MTLKAGFGEGLSLKYFRMGRISDQTKYPLDGAISGLERLIGTDPDNSNATRQFLIDTLVAYFKTKLPIKTPADSKYDGFLIIAGEGNTDSVSVESGDLMIGANVAFSSGEMVVIRSLSLDPDPLQIDIDFEILINLQ